MIRRPSSVIGPGRTTLGTTVPSSATVITILRDWSVTIGAVGDQDRVVALRAGHAEAAELAGRATDIVGLAKIGAAADRAGCRDRPDCRQSSMRPSCGQSVSSSKPRLDRDLVVAARRSSPRAVARW